MPRAFASTRVIDFTPVYAGPFVAGQLTQLGANVIRINNRAPAP